MLGLIITFLITFVLLFAVLELQNFLTIKKSVFLKEEDGVKYWFIKSKYVNARARKSVFFGKNIFVYKEYDERIIAHEKVHLEQINFPYLIILISSLGISISFTTMNPIPVVLSVLYTIALSQHYERDADLRAYKGKSMFPFSSNRPNRLRRIIGWLDTHPPTWIRDSDEYYNKENDLFYLFIRDIIIQKA
ncbi:hypothetical protein [Acidianus sp. HS-5]|uniref:hypothetical protein n=1 Tax=Acidianus sp. HS-5 TaxID=2886040 RepID=UPI001F20AFC0|nr:hypothetical protein [Acidianus sp. HS-5]BDC18238.1 hypothetical protein HS5_11280 [Acidianus sp. HS-5]